MDKKQKWNVGVALAIITLVAVLFAGVQSVSAHDDACGFFESEGITCDTRSQKERVNLLVKCYNNMKHGLDDKVAARLCVAYLNGCVAVGATGQCVDGKH